MFSFGWVFLTIISVVFASCGVEKRVSCRYISKEAPLFYFNTAVFA